MSTPLGEFIRARRDATRPEAVGVERGPRRRVAGLRRSELARLAGISVEYLVRIEQGKDHNPSISVINSLADALRLDATQRWHLRQLAKRGSPTCMGSLAEPGREVRASIRAVLDQLEPGVAVLTNRLGDLLAYTSAFERLAGPTGLLDGASPNLTRFVFTDSRAPMVFPDWEEVADERAIELCLGPTTSQSSQLVAELADAAGETFTARVRLHEPLTIGSQRWQHPMAGELRLEREVLDLPATDGQQLVVMLPADHATAKALDQLRPSSTPLRAVN